MKELNNKQASDWLWQLLDTAIIRSGHGAAALPVDNSAIHFVRKVGQLVVDVQDETSRQQSSPTCRAQREAKVWSEYRERAKELKRLFCSTSENAFFPYTEPLLIPYWAVPWYFSLLYSTAPSLRRNCKKYAYATFHWKIGEELTEQLMEQFEVGLCEQDDVRAQKDLNRLFDLLATTMAYCLFGYAFDRLVENTRKLVTAGKQEEAIIIAARETWADFWILSLPPTILQNAHTAGTALNVTSPETILGAMAGWLNKNMSPVINRHLTHTAQRENQNPTVAVFQDTMAELAIQLEELQEEAMDGYYLRSRATSSLKTLYNMYSKEVAFADPHELTGQAFFESPADEGLMMSEQNVAVQDFVQGLLAPRELEVYALYELPDREIADRLGITIGTVGSHKNRIRKKLRQHASQIL